MSEGKKKTILRLIPTSGIVELKNNMVFQSCYIKTIKAKAAKHSEHWGMHHQHK